MATEKLFWTTRQVQVKTLVSLDINPRKISEEKKKELAESLEKFNLVDIPVVNTDWKIISGNQRMAAMMIVGRGEEMIDVRYPNRPLTEKEIKEYALIGNTHAGEFDMDILIAEFSDIIPEIKFDIPGLGDFMKKQEKELADQAQDDDFDVSINGVKTDIVSGDLIIIGNHKLLCGDATSQDDWKKLMGEELADLVNTDPPYNVDYTGKTKDALKIEGDNKSDLDFYKFLYGFYCALAAFTKQGGGVVRVACR